MAEVRLLETSQLSADDRASIRRLLDEAFARDFSDDDWAHALGGWHAVIPAADAHTVLAHAAVVARRIDVGPTAYRAGFVEAVAVAPGHQRRGLGSAVMEALAEVIGARFELGVLSSGEWSFYERLGWERWRGPSQVRAADGTITRSPEDDDSVMVLRCQPSRDLDPTAAITCDQRTGDSW